MAMTNDPQAGLDNLTAHLGSKQRTLAYLAGINERLKEAEVHKRDRHSVLLMVLRECAPR